MTGPAPRRSRVAGQRADRGATTSAAGLVKVNPIATWTDLDVDGLHPRPRPPRAPARRPRLRVDRLLAVHPPVGEGEDARAGRWAGTDKTECGLHG